MESPSKRGKMDGEKNERPDTDDDKEAVDVDAKKRPVARVLMEVASVIGPRFTCKLPFSRLSCSTNSGLCRYT